MPEIMLEKSQFPILALAKISQGWEVQETRFGGFFVGKNAILY